MRPSAAEPPDGFVKWSGRGAFSAHVGPYFHRPAKGEGDTAELAFFAQAHHANSYGVVHGGMLCAFMDTVLANAVIARVDRPILTIHLATDYLHMARGGRWVRGEGRVTALAGDLAYAEGLAFTDSTAVVRATGVFKVMASRG